MEIVLGVSMTPTTVRMVLVEGERADGVTVDHDVFDIVGIDGAANSNPSDQVIAAILGTQESADAGGHQLLSSGVTWSDHREAAKLREALAARRIDDVMLVSQLHAAGALAQAAGRAVGHDTTAVMFIEPDTATASVVDTSDGSIRKVDSRSLHSADAMDVLTDMATGIESDASVPEGIFLLGSGVDIAALREHLENHVSIPVNAPEDPDMALARGAALAAASAPTFDAATVGLAYSQDPDGTTASEVYPAEDAATEGAAAAYPDFAVSREDRKPFMLVGSSLTAIFVVGVVALVISLAVSIRPTVDTRPNPGDVASAPPIAPPHAAVNPQPAPPPAAAPPAPAPAPPPVAETIAPPVPVVQQQPLPRRVVAAPAPAPEAPPPAPVPEAPPPAPILAPVPQAPVYLPPQAPGYLPPQAPGYLPPQAPEYLPPQAPAYIPPPLLPVVGLPPIIGFGPGPSGPRQRGSDRWDPPQQQWPSGPGSYGPGPGSYGPGPGSYGPGPGSRGSGGGNPGRGSAPFWPWG
jgi:hypothetical protein